MCTHLHIICQTFQKRLVSLYEFLGAQLCDSLILRLPKSLVVSENLDHIFLRTYACTDHSLSNS